MRSSPKRGSSSIRRVARSSATERPIRFGTSGWRGEYGDEITLPRLRVLVRSVAHWLIEKDRQGTVLVGFDRRFASHPLAETTAALLEDAGFVVELSSNAVPTPALTHTLRQSDAIAGLMLTASHNPAEDHGLKVFGGSGGTISDAEARRIEEIAAARMRDDGESVRTTPPTRAEWMPAYRAALESLLDTEALSRSGLVVVYDAMHGSGADVLDRVLREGGADVRSLRNETDPHFGGEAPDPVQENLGRLGQATAALSGLRIGLATDGDADRFGVVDSTGRALTETQVVALLVDDLAGRGLIRKGIALTEGAGSLIEAVAESHGLRVERHPVGFKHLSSALASGRVDAAGEESGGFAFEHIGHDKDGIAAGCLLANLVATSGQPLEVHVKRLEAQFGVSACGRRAVRRSAARDRALARWQSTPPTEVAGSQVAPPSTSIPTATPTADTGQGRLRLDFEDGGFLILRPSGTEARMRIYAEAPTPAALEARLRAAVEYLEAAEASSSASKTR